MANTLAPFGLRYVSRNDGAQPNYAIQTRPIYYTNASQIGYGDPVRTVSTGINQGTLTIASTGTQVAGVFIGCTYTDSVLGLVERPSWAAPTTAIAGSVAAKYIPDSNAVFEIQAGNTAITVGQTSIGLNAAFGTIPVPNSAGISAAFLDATTIATTNTLPLRIIGYSTGFYNGAPNDPTSPYPVLLVTLNNLDATNTTGV